MKSKQEHINKLFQSRVMFEKEVLHVHNDHDRTEVINILATNLVRGVLREHLNFLYIHDLSNFTLQQIVNILFKEIANEWIDYAIDELKISKKEALEELKLEKRVQFLRLLATDYYKRFKEYIFGEIADTFIELLVLNTQVDKHSIFINKVINSDFIPNRSLLNINSSDQLCKAAKYAKDTKDMEVDYLETQIAEIQAGILNEKLSITKREDLNIILPSYEQKLKETQAIKLEDYEETLKRVKRAIIASLKEMDT